MPSQPSPRGRILIATAAAVALTALIVVIAGAGSGGEAGGREAVAPPPRCVRSWNADQAARAYGRHNYSSHHYLVAMVTFLR